MLLMSSSQLGDRLRMIIRMLVNSNANASAARAPPCPPRCSHGKALGVANAVVPTQMRSWREGRTCQPEKKSHANLVRRLDHSLDC